MFFFSLTQNSNTFLRERQKERTKKEVVIPADQIVGFKKMLSRKKTVPWVQVGEKRKKKKKDCFGVIKKVITKKVGHEKKGVNVQEVKIFLPPSGSSNLIFCSFRTKNSASGRTSCNGGTLARGPFKTKKRKKKLNSGFHQDCPETCKFF